MTAIIYFGEIVVALMLAIFWLATSTFSWGKAVILFSGGAVALTLGEYTVHRFLLHNIATTQHRIHHAHPDEAIDKIFWQIWVCFAVVYLIAGGVVLAGALAAYASVHLSVIVLLGVKRRSGRHLLERAADLVPVHGFRGLFEHRQQHQGDRTGIELLPELSQLRAFLVHGR